MIQILPVSLYEQIRPLFAMVPHHPILNGIVMGRNNGRIYVDDLEGPACALVWGRNMRSSICSEIRSARHSSVHCQLGLKR